MSGRNIGPKMKTSASLAPIRGTITWAPVLAHSARTAVAAVVSLLAARFCRLPESYWAPITTLVIAQSSFGAALSVSGERFMGTVLGATVGIIVASCLGSNFVVFGISVFILGLLSAALHSARSAYRFAGVTLAIVLLVPSANSAWRIALHRFAEVCIGIGVALILAVLWPEREEQHH
jgi:uncharacterized membrane protein YgaE (UPF0421/DUF939 family)